MHTTRISGKTMKRTVLFLAIAALFCFTVNAQAQSSIHYLMDFDTMEYIGSLAHPAQTVLNAEVTRSTASYIDINIKFESLMRNYWEPYRINLKQFRGTTYAYSIVRTKSVSIYEPFIAIEWATSLVSSLAANMGYSKSDNEEAVRALYGTSESGLTKEQKAAIMLMNYLFGD